MNCTNDFIAMIWNISVLFINLILLYKVHITHRLFNLVKLKKMRFSSKDSFRIYNFTTSFHFLFLRSPRGDMVKKIIPFEQNNLFRSHGIIVDKPWLKYNRTALLQAGMELEDIMQGYFHMELLCFYSILSIEHKSFIK